MRKTFFALSTLALFIGLLSAAPADAGGSAPGLSPDHYNFQTQRIGPDFKSIEVTIVNINAQPLTLQPPFTIQGANAGDFTVGAPNAVDLAGAGGTAKFIVEFHPTSPGHKTAEVLVHNSHSDAHFQVQGEAIKNNRFVVRLTDPSNGGFQLKPEGKGCESLPLCYTFKKGTKVKVKALPNDGYQVSAWGDDCAEFLNKPKCKLKMNSDKNVSIDYVPT